MLTKEEIRNLRIGDEIYDQERLYKIIELTESEIRVCDGIVDYYSDLDDSKLSLNPPKKMKKYWLWAYKGSKGNSLTCTDFYYSEDDVKEYSILNDAYFKQKLDYTMIEIEEE